MTKPKILFCTEIPTPYRDPVFESLQKNTSYDLEVLYLSKGQKNRKWQMAGPLKAHFLDAHEWISYKTINVYLAKGVARALEKISPDTVIVSGYAQPIMWQVRAYAIKKNIPYLTFSESHGLKDRNAFLVWIKKIILRPFYKKAIWNFTTGSLAKDYIVSLGADETKVSYFPNTIDMESYSKEVLKYKANKGLGLPFEFLFVGHLELWKGVDILLNSFLEAFSAKENVCLRFVGNGSALELLQSIVPLERKHQVVFSGFVSPGELPEVYASANVFVLPSRNETWGVVVLEAIAAKLPVISSNGVGAVLSLLENGTSVEVFQKDNVSACIAAMKKVYDSTVYADKLAKNALVVSREWSMPKTVENFSNVIKALTFQKSVKKRE